MLPSIMNFKERLKPYYKSLRQRIIQRFKSSPDPREIQQYQMTYAQLKVTLRQIWDLVNKDEQISEYKIDAIVTEEADKMMKSHWTYWRHPDSNIRPTKVRKKIRNDPYANPLSFPPGHRLDPKNPRLIPPHWVTFNSNGFAGGKRKTAKSNTKNVVKKSKNVNNAKKPAAKKPAAKKPAAKKPAAKKPAAKKPAAKKPATKKPTAKKSATAKSKSRK